MTPDLSTISTPELEATAVDLEALLRDATDPACRARETEHLDAVRSELTYRAGLRADLTDCVEGRISADDLIAKWTATP